MNQHLLIYASNVVGVRHLGTNLLYSYLLALRDKYLSYLPGTIIVDSRLDTLCEKVIPSLVRIRKRLREKAFSVNLRLIPLA